MKRNENSEVPDIGVNRFYRNKGNGQFDEIGAAAGVDDGGAGFQPVFFDYDLDGDVDLYLANDKGSSTFHNQLWKNVGGAFVNVSAESGAGAIGDLMGVAIGDLDRNGHPDIYTTNVGNITGNPLLLNQGDGTFVLAQAEAGVAAIESGWATLFFDHDNDGDEDLYLVNSFSPNRLFRYDGFFPTVEIGSVIGLGDSGNSFCIAIGDIDNDGDLDIVLQNHLEGIKILINHVNDTPDGLHNYLKIKLAGLGPNRFAVGARVEVEVAGDLQSRQVFAGIGFKSTSSYVQHFGLGSATTIDRLTVTWPGGSRTTLTDVPANQTLTVTQVVQVDVPTVSVWGLIAAGMLLLTAGTVILRQPRHAGV